ncbi:MAG: response regulator [Phycisphaerales bacterium]
MPSETPTNPITEEDAADLDGSRVLIVDDNPQNVELLEAYLEALPCETLVARDGVEAIEKVEREKPDIILLDIMMPRMSGYEVCQKIKSDPATRDIPVLMVTALNEVGDVERGVEAGADDFLSKPFHKLEFLTRVRSLLKMRLLKKRLDDARAREIGAPPSIQIIAPTPEELDEETSIED